MVCFTKTLSSDSPKTAGKSPKFSNEEEEVNTGLAPSIKAELKVMLLSISSATPASPLDSLISPSDLRRSIHFVDPSLSRNEVNYLTQGLLGNVTAKKVLVAKVINALEKL
jgi:hypothetical protein